MKKITIVWLISSLFSQTGEIYEPTLFQAGYTFIDFHDLNNDEKMHVLYLAELNPLSVIIYTAEQGIKIQKIISINEDHIVVQLLDYWWWNEPKEKHSILKQNMANIESTTNGLMPHDAEIFRINDIVALKIEDKKSILGSVAILFPIILVGLVMLSMGLY